MGRWHWLGLVDWGRTGDGWTASAVTETLQQVVTGASSGTPKPGPGVRHERAIRSDRAGDADLPTLFRSERYLTYRGGDAEERRYDLTPASVARGIHLGGDEDELLALLSRLLQADLPEASAATIAGWCRAHGTLRLEPRVLLVGSDDQALAAALDVEDARNAIVDQNSRPAMRSWRWIRSRPAHGPRESPPTG